MSRFLSIKEAAKALGVSVSTLRRWDATGKLVAEHTSGGHRRYDLAKLKPEWFRAAKEETRRTIAYARVSSHDQKDDLERQKQVLELYCARQGWTFFEEDLARDVLEIITVFSARLYGSRSGRNQKLLEAVKKVAEHTSC